MILAFLLISALSAQASFDWVMPTSSGTLYSYCYAPGILSSELLLARYCPSFVASTGESISCQQGIETMMGQFATGCTFPEIELYCAQGLSGIRYRMNYKLFLAEHMNYGITFATQATSGKTLACHSINFSAINVAQKNDLKAFSDHVKEHRKSFGVPGSTHSTILYGSSRGAAAVFNYAALSGDPLCSALVCEGIFDTVENTSAHGTWGTSCKVGLVKNSWLTNFKKNGTSPLAVYKKMRKDIPIALITSKADTIVPYKCTYNLYTKLKAAGHKQVHILVLEKSTHNAYAFGPEKDIYRNFIHAFYKKYNVPYIAEYASAGVHLLK